MPRSHRGGSGFTLRSAFSGHDSSTKHEKGSDPLGGSKGHTDAHKHSGGGLGMALLPFGMVALDRYAAKRGKRKSTRKTRRKSSRRQRGGTNCTLAKAAQSCGRQRGGHNCPYAKAAQSGGRRRTRTRHRRRRTRTRHRRRRTRTRRR